MAFERREVFGDRNIVCKTVSGRQNQGSEAKLPGFGGQRSENCKLLRQPGGKLVRQPRPMLTLLHSSSFVLHSSLLSGQQL